MLNYKVYSLLLLSVWVKIRIDTVSEIHIYIIKYIPYSEFYPWYLMTVFDF